MTFSAIIKFFIDWRNVIKRITIDLLKVLLAIAIVLNIKALCIYLMHHSDYIITYNLCDYYTFLSKTINPQLNYFAAITAILSAVISLAIPLSINQVANSLKDYNDLEISNMFFKEPVFFQMVSVLIFLFLSLVIWYFVTDYFIIATVLLSFLTLTLYYSFHFFNRVIEYITATDDVVHDYFHNNATKLFDFDYQPYYLQ